MAIPHKPRKRKRRYRLTPAGAAALRAAIHKTQPWLKSTGPRTTDGKGIARRNALKHAYYSREPLDDLLEFRAFMRQWARSLKGSQPRWKAGVPVWDDERK